MGLGFGLFSFGLFQGLFGATRGFIWLRLARHCKVLSELGFGFFGVWLIEVSLQLRLALGVFVGIVIGLDRGAYGFKTAGLDRASAVFINGLDLQAILGVLFVCLGCTGFTRRGV